MKSQLIFFVVVGLLGSGHSAVAQQSDLLGQLISPVPAAKPEVIKSGQERKAPDKRSDSAGLPPSENQPISTSVPLASQLKACSAVVSGRVEARYLPSTLTEQMCGDEAPLEVSKVGSLVLKPAVQMNCRMTVAVANWLEEVSKLSWALLDKSLVTVETASGYVCRRRNNKPDGKFSEHATMNALDVSGFVLSDGQRISVLDDWQERALVERKKGEPRSRLKRADHPSTSKARFLRASHAEVCKNFTTVLGPDGDDHHKNHFHVDLGCHGKNCTWRLCQ